MTQPLLYPPTTNAIQKQLNANYTSGGTVLTLTNTTNVQNKPGICVVNRIDINGTAQSAASRTYFQFTGTSGATLTGCTVVAGSTDQDHATGEVVEFISDVTWAQMIADGLATLLSTSDVTAVNTTNVVTPTGSQTLTNKTLTSPVISTISNTGTLTLPTSTDTLVGRATTDTLTNKTLTSPSLTGTVSVAGAITQSGTADHITLTPGSSKLVKVAALEQNYAGTNTYRNNTIILTGYGIIEPGGSVTNASEAVSFGVTFSTTPMVLISAAGRAATSTTALGSFAGAGIRYSWFGHSISTTGFTALIANTDAADGNLPNFAYAYTWIAIGTL